MSDTLLGSHSFGVEEVYRVKWSPSSPDLVAAGTSNSLHILRLDPKYTPSLVTDFRLGSRVTHLSWGPTLVSEDGKNLTLRIECALPPDSVGSLCGSKDAVVNLSDSYR